MATIKEKIIQQRDLILSPDPKIAAETTARLRSQAIEAMYNGPGSDEWIAFMNNFADTDEQRARLHNRRAGDLLCNRYIDLARTYLIANATCTPNTTQNFLDGIDDILDQTLGG